MLEVGLESVVDMKTVSLDLLKVRHHNFCFDTLEVLGKAGLELPSESV